MAWIAQLFIPRRRKNRRELADRAAEVVQHVLLDRAPQVDLGDLDAVEVAQVVAAAELSDAQRTRLTEVLSRIYGHPVAIQLTVDPDVLGGLSIAVGDEVIDGSIASRLAAAQTQLPD